MTKYWKIIKPTEEEKEAYWDVYKYLKRHLKNEWTQTKTRFKVDTSRMQYYTNYDDKEYKYGNIRLYSQEWLDMFTDICYLLTDKLKENYKFYEKIDEDSFFDTLLLNYYRDGNDYISAHSDNEKNLDTEYPIVCLSLGETRNLNIRKKISHGESSHKDDNFLKRYELAHGDIFIMFPGMQNKYTHEIPKSQKNMSPRISITARRYDSMIINP